MSSYLGKKKRYRIGRVVTILTGIFINCILGLVAYKLNIPLYFDTVGTIGVTLIAGAFPGIVTGVVTNVICSLFNSNALYYSIISALIAIATSWFSHYYKTKKWRFFLVLIAAITLISGILGTTIQFILMGRPQFEFVSDIAVKMSYGSVGYFFSAMLINTGLNLADKGMMVILALILSSCVPENIKNGIRDSVWQQAPLPVSEKARVGFDAFKKKDGRSSLYKRISVTLVFVAFLITISVCLVSIELYQKNLKKEYTENAHNAAKLASTVIDAEMVDEYIANGESVSGYLETRERLYNIRDNSNGVKYLYVVQIRDDGCYVAFDLETEDTPAYEPGDKIEFEAAFEPYLPALFAGEEIPAIESNDVSGWVITAYYPVRDAEGHTACYVGADVSMLYLNDYIRSFLAKTILIFSGLFVLIIGYGIWLAEYYLVFPIRSMTECTREYERAGENQEQIDANANKIKSIDIRTNDEIQDLYESVSKMSVDMAEQVRSIRKYADTNMHMQNGLITTMANMVESRDSDTGAHIQKTAEYVKIIVEGLRKKGYYTGKITDKFVSDVIMSAPLHDIGKINITDIVLNKKGRLTNDEFEIMKTHTTAGKELIEKVISTVQGESYLKEARYMAAYHHERFDGKGYPEGLHGEEIPLSARIMAVADVFDALVSKRIYKPAFSVEKSVEILEEGSGTQFDPKCIEVFLESMDLVREVLAKYQE